jgi:hypothetical protein
MRQADTNKAQNDNFIGGNILMTLFDVMRMNNNRELYSICDISHTPSPSPPLPFPL